LSNISGFAVFAGNYAVFDTFVLAGLWLHHVAVGAFATRSTEQLLSRPDQTQSFNARENVVLLTPAQC
jgi:hypothetical protein